jgi:hypothetical protein
MKVRPVLLVAALATMYMFAGCGGGSSSAPDPSSVAPVDSSIYIEGTVRPDGSLKTNLESLAANVAGIDDLSATIVEKIEESAQQAEEPFSYEKEVEPWLGEKAGIFLSGYHGQNFNSVGIALQVTDADAGQEFIEKHVKADKGETIEKASYEGVDYELTSDGTSLGIVGDFIVYAKEVQTFKDVVAASNGENLAETDRYSEAIESAPDSSLADVYVDIGALVKQSGQIDPQAQLFLNSAGIDVSEATATASAIPGSDNVEIDFSTDVTGENPPSGDASGLLGSLPAESFAAFASPEFGKGLEKAIDSIDESGIPGQIPPHRFKEVLKSAGIDLEQIAGSIGDVGVFAEGTSKSTLNGAVVLTTDDATEATNTVSNIGLLLRASHTPGVTAIGGKAAGFSVRSTELGRKPIVVAAEGKRISIGYGLPAALQGLSESGQTLSGTAPYKEAVSALGGTPITGFVDGPAALRLVDSLVPGSETGYLEARPYLDKVSYVAEGGGVADGRTTAKLIVGFKK